jgi:ubiquinone/menaquinone biosynthesis C-methylase UbiE
LNLLTRMALVWYTLRNDIVEVALRLSGRDVRKETADAAKGSPEVIVDLLTGVGAVLPAYARRFPDARIITVDLDARLLATVRRHLERKGFKGIEVLAADARELPIPAYTADLVNISFGLHELKWLDRELVLGEACRLLKPGGQIIVADYRAPGGIARRAAMRLYFYLFEPRWIRELFYGGLEKQVLDAGFEVETVRTDLPLTQLILADKSQAESCGPAHLRLIK